VTEGEEQAARQIADRGRAAVVKRLRPVFEQAAASHAHLVLVPIGPADLERMVQAAADRADGVLWRRALADVAVDELGIGLGEAIAHPAVRRAHELLGAPIYEPEARPEPEPEPVAQSAREDERELAPEPEPDAERELSLEPEPPAAPGQQAIRVTAIHLSGIETLRDGARNIELLFSAAGLDVVDTALGDTIGRLTWEDITELEVPRGRRSLRPRRDRSPRLVVRTDRGQAYFELPGLTEEQVHEHLAPMFARARAL